MSILKKIVIFFILNFIVMSVIGVWIDSINNKRINSLIIEKYLNISNEIIENFNNQEKLNSILNLNELQKIKSIKTGDLIFKKRHIFGDIKIYKKSFLSSIYFLEVDYLDEKFKFLIDEKDISRDKNILNILVVLDIVMLLVVYFIVLKVLLPIKQISKEIQKFANGDFTNRSKHKSNDEIGVLSNSFNKMGDNLQALIKTREEFLRHVGHELKTPIAKGRFLIEKLEDEKSKEKLKNVFLNLDEFINELIELDRIDAINFKTSTFDSETLVLESLNRLLLDDETKIDISIKDNFRIKGDLDYLSIALKNLIDNALKYSHSFPIKIETINNEIKVFNTSTKLSKELANYLEPFYQEDEQNNGFGLGLAIVNKILNRHNFFLNYIYINNQNVFTIKTL